MAKYKEREEVNREIKLLEGQIKGIEAELPANYNGEEWKVLKIQDYYNKVAEAQKINNYIKEAKRLQEGINEKNQSINNAAENNKSKIKAKFNDQRQDIKDIIVLAKSKIEKANDFIGKQDERFDIEFAKIDMERQKEIDLIMEKYRNIKNQKSSELHTEIEEQKDIINVQNQKISAKEQEISSLANLEIQEIKAEDVAAKSEIEKAELKVGKAAEYLEKHKETEIEPLQTKADEVANMQSYLREWDRMLDIRDGKLATKKAYSDSLTGIIEVARNKPAELLKQHKLPIDGISVDENSMIRINKTLLDGLSDGEKLEAAFKIALQRIGELRIMCLDGFEKLNETEQKKIIRLCEDNDIQAFVTITKDTASGEFEIKESL
jgi:exonuclease SbcC